jgi:hypothetical protein
MPRGIPNNKKKKPGRKPGSQTTVKQEVSEVLETLNPKPKEEINPFGKVTDYLSVSVGYDDNHIVVSDGTSTIRVSELRVRQSSNFSKPHEILNSDGTSSMLLTPVQLKTLLTEYVRLFGDPWKSESK